MKIKYMELDYADSACKLVKRNSKVPVLKHDIHADGTCVRYEVLLEEPPKRVGQEMSWSDTSGHTSTTTYLGMIELEVIDLPPWARSDISEEEDLDA